MSLLRLSAWIGVCLGLVGVGCSCADPPELDAGVDGGLADPPPPDVFADVEQTGRFVIPELSAHGHVVRTEHDVPHVYAENREDAMRILGFVMAQDRYFQMDLTARFALGTLSELLGELGLPADLENRQTGTAYVVDLALDALTEAEGREMDAFAEGVNAYVEAARRARLPAPKELQLGFGLLGGRNAADLMQSWDRRTVVATGVTALYGTSFETGDVGRDRAWRRLSDPDPTTWDVFVGMPNRSLRLDGLIEDVIARYAPPRDSSSAAGWGLETANVTSAPIVTPQTLRRPTFEGAVRVEPAMHERLARHLARIDARLHPAQHEGWGSNAWAVAASATTDGRALLAGDGHLELSVPALFWSFGIDTALLGDSGPGARQLGSTIAGLPVIGVGTNGHVAWSQTAFFADVTDWYTEEIVLDSEGAPRASVFRGEERALMRVDEVFEIADIAAFDSVGRTATIPRFATFDGRFITSVEGRTVTEDEALGAGESRINLMGEWVVPSDTDGDGEISAISMYYGPFDGGSLFRAFRGFTESQTVEDYRQSMRHFIGYGGSMIAADSSGSVLYSAYHAVPCRTYLPRDPDTGAWQAGADPRRLLDGTQYPAWSIPLDAEGRVDEGAAASGPDTGCAVPFDAWPQALDPARAYVHHANNDPGNIYTDNDPYDDPHYIGGPWIEGYRAARIEERLRGAIDNNRADIAEMARIQADDHSNLGAEWAPVMLGAIAAARDAAAGSTDPGSAAERMASMWASRGSRFEEVEQRIEAWADAGFPTPSGVETFYSTPTAADRALSVAVTIHAQWLPRFFSLVLDDEGIDRSWSPAVTGGTYVTQLMLRLIAGRGASNPGGLGSWSTDTEESVFFDDVATPEIETSDEIALRALAEALDALEAEPSGPGTGGFGTPNMDAWIWGLRHQVRFESLIAGYVDDDSIAPLLELFNITTARIPLAPNLDEADPRFALKWFPRPGDQFGVDAANPGLDVRDFTYGAGPVFRMVIALGPDGVQGQTILPGGQSGNPDSEHFADQAALWLANEATPMRFLPEEVAAGAQSRQRFAPAP